MTIAASPIRRFPSTASRSSLSISDEGLKVEPDFLLLRMAKGRPAQAGDRERCLVLLSILAKRAVSSDVLLDVAAAAAHLGNGDKALAHLRLAFARIPLVATADDVVRLRAAAFLLGEGLSPRCLMHELGLATTELDRLSKYDENQPRVPAGNGRSSGQWGSSASRAGTATFVIPAVAARGFLAGATPDIVAALTRFALRFTAATAVFGAAFIPTPNSGGVTEGTLIGAPDVGFHFDGPAGKLVLTVANATIVAGVQAGFLVDVRTGQQIGRNLGGQLYLALGLVHELALFTNSRRKRSVFAGTREISRRLRSTTRSRNSARHRKRTHHTGPPRRREITRMMFTSASIQAFQYPADLQSYLQTPPPDHAISLMTAFAVTATSSMAT